MRPFNMFEYYVDMHNSNCYSGLLYIYTIYTSYIHHCIIHQLYTNVFPSKSLLQCDRFAMQRVL